VQQRAPYHISVCAPAIIVNLGHSIIRCLICRIVLNTPQIEKGDPWPIFRRLIEALHKDIGDIKDLAGKQGKEKKLERLRKVVRHYALMPPVGWIACANSISA
jgi:hypothetical protein